MDLPLPARCSASSSFILLPPPSLFSLEESFLVGSFSLGLNLDLPGSLTWLARFREIDREAILAPPFMAFLLSTYTGSYECRHVTPFGNRFPDSESYSYNKSHAMIVILTTDRSMIPLAQNCEVIHICESVRLKTCSSLQSAAALAGVTCHEDKNISAVPPMFPSHSPHQSICEHPLVIPAPGSRFACEAFTK